MPDWQVVEENQLLHEAQCGNAEAFGELYGRYAPAIYRFLVAHLDNPLDAEDLTEEVFLRAWRSLSQYRTQGLPFSAFLFRIAHNLRVDFYRKSRRMNQAVAEDADVELVEENDPAGHPEAGLEHMELHRRMQALREDYRTVLAARFISGMTPEETAGAMRRSVGAVRVLQHRALTALRKLLETDDETLER